MISGALNVVAIYITPNRMTVIDVCQHIINFDVPKNELDAAVLIILSLLILLIVWIVTGLQTNFLVATYALVTQVIFAYAVVFYLWISAYAKKEDSSEKRGPSG